MYIKIKGGKILLIFKDVDKSYGKNKANRNINISFESGKVYGLLGRDYSGKSTLMKLAAGQIKPNNGQITLDDSRIYENSKVIEMISLAREDGIGIDDLKIEKMMDMASVSYKNWDEDFKNLLVNEFEMDTNTRFYKLSKEEQNLVGIIIGLASRAEWTMFDELSFDLSKTNAMKFREILKRDLENNPRTVIISNRDVDETVELFDNIVVMRDGKIILDESMDTVESKLLYISGDGSKMDDIEAYKQIIFKESFGDTIVLGIYDEVTEEEKIGYKARGLSISKMPFDRGYKYFTEDSIEKEKDEEADVVLKMDYSPKADDVSPEPAIADANINAVETDEEIIESEPVRKSEPVIKLKPAPKAVEEADTAETDIASEHSKSETILNLTEDKAVVEEELDIERTDRIKILDSDIDAKSNTEEGGDIDGESE